MVIAVLLSQVLLFHVIRKGITYREKNKPNSSGKDAPITYLFETYNDRERLFRQFLLLQDMFNAAFTDILKLGNYDLNPETADWRVLDAGCGEGLFSEEIVSNYPHTHIVGFDRDAEAVATANIAFRSRGDLYFFTHDALKPLPKTLRLLNGKKISTSFDIALAWLVLTHIKNASTALANIAAVLKPGGTILLLDNPTTWFTFPHPSFMALEAVVSEALNWVSFFGFGSQHLAQLEKAGFTDIKSVQIEFLLGGTTEAGQRWLKHYLDLFKAARKTVVEVLGLMSATEFDSHISRIKSETTIDMIGYAYVVQTIARKPLEE